MDEDEQQEDVNPLFGGVDNVNNDTMETMFDLSAYLSDNNDKLTLTVMIITLVDCQFLM